MNKISTEYGVNKKNPKGFWLGFKNVMDDAIFPVFLCVVFFFVGFFLPGFVSLGILEAKIGSCLLCGIAFFIISLIIYSLLDNMTWLKPYGLSKKTPIFVIDFREEQVKQVELICAYLLKESFDDTVFECVYGGEEYLINGEDIFFSLKDANAALNFVQKENDGAIKKYFPEWEKDKNFTDFYRSRTQSGVRRFGFGGRCGYSTDIVLTPIKIDDIKLLPNASAKNFVKNFLNEMKKIEKRKQAETKEDQAIIDNLNRYKSKAARLKG